MFDASGFVNKKNNNKYVMFYIVIEINSFIYIMKLFIVIFDIANYQNLHLLIVKAILWKFGF